MKSAALMMTLSLTACQAVAVDPARKDVQRCQPDAKEATARYLVKHDRPIAEFLVENRKKDREFGCSGGADS